MAKNQKSYTTEFKKQIVDLHYIMNLKNVTEQLKSIENLMIEISLAQ